MIRLLSIVLLCISCNNDPYVPQPVNADDAALLSRFGLSNAKYRLGIPDCRMMDGRTEAFTAITADGKTVEGSICNGATFDGSKGGFQMIEDEFTLDFLLCRVQELEDERDDLHAKIIELEASLADANDRVLLALEDGWGCREYR